MKNSLKMLLRLVTLLMVPTLLSGCANSIAETADVKSPLCSVAIKPVCISDDDKLTPRTAETILKNNEGLRAVCGSRAVRCVKEKKPSTDPKTS